jgi:hypothetical protein
MMEVMIEDKGKGRRETRRRKRNEKTGGERTGKEEKERTHVTPVHGTYAPCTGSLVGGGISPSSSKSSSSSYLEVDRY